MMRFPEAVVTRLAKAEVLIKTGGIFCSPLGGVGGGETGTGDTLPVVVSRRWSPPVPRITTLPSFPTATASGREPML